MTSTSSTSSLRALWLVMCLLAHMVVAASPADTTSLRLRDYRKGWACALPTHAKLQFAGGTGLLSVAVGWAYGKDLRWESDLSVGFLPKTASTPPKAVFAFRQSVAPFAIRLGHSPFTIRPATLSLGASYVDDKKLWLEQPDRYPVRYYKFPTRASLIMGFGQRCDFRLPSARGKRSKTISVYYDLSTYEKYLMSGVQNKCIKFSDIIKLDIGLRIQIL